jgi:hypothetical protein
LVALLDPIAQPSRTRLAPTVGNSVAFQEIAPSHAVGTAGEEAVMRKTLSRSRTLLPIVALATAIVLAVGSISAFATDFTDVTSLTIHRSPTGTLSVGEKVTISGKLKSAHVACHSHKTINLWRKKKGQATYHLIATTTTTTTGHYSFVKHPRRTARYYTKFNGTKTGVHPNRHTCLPSKSAIIKIPVA